MGTKPMLKRVVACWHIVDVFEAAVETGIAGRSAEELEAGTADSVWDWPAPSSLSSKTSQVRALVFA
jgi:hypothetical protein